MKTEVAEIQAALKRIMLEYTPPLQVTKDTEGVMELAGTKPCMQGKQKVEGHYFSSVMPKPKDVRLYFFPIYTHVDAFKEIPEALRKCLKGKSCFHIKKMDEDLENAIRDMVKLGLEVYQKNELI